MELLLWLLLAAAALHVVEEWLWPGGFLDWFRRFAPFAAALTPGLAVVVNAAFLALVLAAAILAEDRLVLSLSAAALCFVNGLLHVVGTIKTREYSPGVVTGALLYLPLAVAVYAAADAAGPGEWIASILLGIGYQAAVVAGLRLRVATGSVRAPTR
jgi:preprotein translocase subunit Sec61beta